MTTFLAVLLTLSAVGFIAALVSGLFFARDGLWISIPGMVVSLWCLFATSGFGPGAVSLLLLVLHGLLTICSSGGEK